MRAARLHGLGAIQVDDIPPPRPGPGEALVRVRAVGICRSDLHLYQTGEIGSVTSPEPFVPGHEAGGVVEAGGELAPGTRVAIDPTRPCGACDLCRAGRCHLCRRLRFLSMPPTPGALQEYLACPPQCLVPVPEGVPDHLVPLAEPLAVALHALDLAGNLPPTVIILGAGAIGLLLVQLTAQAGARVLATEPLAERRELALSLGAAEAFDPGQPDLVPRLWAATGDLGAPLVLEAAGDEATVAQAVACAGPGGRVVVVGIPEQDRVEFPASLARRRELCLVFSRRYHCQFVQGVRMMAEGNLQLAPLVTERFPLDRVAEAFAAAAARQAGIRTVVEL